MAGLIAALLFGLLTAHAGPAPTSASKQSWREGNVYKPEFEDMVHQAHLIVLGKVIEVSRIKHPGPSKERPSSRKYTFWEDNFAILEVEETLKGKRRSRVKIAFHSDLEGDKTDYRMGSRYLAFLTRPSKYPDAYTTTYFHFGEYRINDQGRAERVADPSEISKPPAALVERVEAVLNQSGKGR